MKKWIVSVSVAVAMSSNVVNSATPVGNPKEGQTKGALCAGCHGPDGNSPNPAWPNLAGQHSNYLYKQIMDFKSQARQDPMMSAQAAVIQTPQDVADISAYFANLTMAKGKAKPEAVNLGGQIYRGGNLTTGVAACTGCHGPTGMGIPQANFPRIAGQNVDYMIKALKDFRAGTRTNGPNGMMRGVTARMTDAEMEAVAEFVHGLSE
jgi:cytochrome c553